MAGMESAKQLARICKVLAVATRLRIIQLLKGRSLCVGALSARLNVTQGAVSQHLRILRDAGLVTAQKRGYFVHYRLNHESLQKCRAVLDELLQADAGPFVDHEVTFPDEREKPCAKRNRNAKDRTS